jgi:hypothetical protein
VHRTGLIELLWALTYEDDSDALTIDLVEMAYIVMRSDADSGSEDLDGSLTSREGVAPLRSG